MSSGGPEVDTLGPGHGDRSHLALDGPLVDRVAAAEVHHLLAGHGRCGGCGHAGTSGRAGDSGAGFDRRDLAEIEHRRAAHEERVRAERHPEAGEPGVVVDPTQRWHGEPHERRGDSRDEGHHRAAAPEPVETVGRVELGKREAALADPPVVGDEDPGDGSQETGIGDEPADVPIGVLQEPPGHDGDADEPGEDSRPGRS